MRTTRGLSSPRTSPPASGGVSFEPAEGGQFSPGGDIWTPRSHQAIGRSCLARTASRSTSPIVDEDVRIRVQRDGGASVSGCGCGRPTLPRRGQLSASRSSATRPPKAIAAAGRSVVPGSALVSHCSGHPDARLHDATPSIPKRHGWVDAPREAPQGVPALRRVVGSKASRVPSTLGRGRSTCPHATTYVHGRLEHKPEDRCPHVQELGICTVPTQSAPALLTRSIDRR